MEFEKSGYSWIKDMPLSELIKPENIDRIKKFINEWKSNEKNSLLKMVQ